jgi:cell volume regulation protein A
VPLALVVEDQILIAGGILALAVVAAVATRRLQLPLLVTFLALGMLLGSEGIGGIYFDDAELARSIGVIGLLAILFEGGLTTDWSDIRPVLAPAFLLSTLGVAVTAAVTGAAAWALLDLSPAAAFLLGAVVGSTDAAAVFATLRFTTLRRRLAALLGAESGANDPTAVALTLGLIAWVTKPSYGAGDLAVLVVRQLGVGLVIGIALGFVAARLLPLLPRDLAPIAPVASVATAALAYGIADEAGASGFLSVYIVALWVGNTPMPLRRPILTFHEGLAFLAQVVLFIVLGLLVFPSRLGPVAAASLALAAVLLFVARPVAVLLSTPGSTLTTRERVFLSWAGLRGAVPIVLATFVLSAGVGASQTIFNAVFLRRDRVRLGPGAHARRLRAPPRPSRHDARLGDGPSADGELDERLAACAAKAVPKLGQRARRERDLGDRRQALVDEPLQPTERRTLEPLRVSLGEQDAQLERVVEAEASELACGEIGLAEVAVYDGAGEAAVRGALRSHERMFALAPLPI